MSKQKQTTSGAMVGNVNRATPIVPTLQGLPGGHSASPDSRAHEIQKAASMGDFATFASLQYNLQ